jgi:hypothetical protein
VGDRAGEGKTYGNLGNAYQWLGDFSKANEYHMQKLDIAKEVGDRAGESQAYGSQRRLNEHDEVVVWYKAELAIFKELGIVHMQAQARWVWEWPCG